MIYALIFLLIVAVVLAVLMSVTDARRRIIPDIFLFPFLLIGILLSADYMLPWITGGIMGSATAAIIGYFLGITMNWIFKSIKKDHAADYIGMGDIKLLAAGGIWLGITGLAVALVTSCIIGGIWGIAHKQKFIPFAPFFFIGMIVAIILAEQFGYLLV